MFFFVSRCCVVCFYYISSPVFNIIDFQSFVLSSIVSTTAAAAASSFFFFCFLPSIGTLIQSEFPNRQRIKFHSFSLSRSWWISIVRYSLLMLFNFHWWGKEVDYNLLSLINSLVLGLMSPPHLYKLQILTATAHSNFTIKNDTKREKMVN